MHKTLLILCALMGAWAVVPSVAEAQTARSQGAGADRSGGLEFLPPGWKLTHTDQARQAQHYVSPDGLSTLAIYAAAADRNDPGAYQRWFETAPGERVTYKRKGRMWMVVSGFKADRIFYRKALLACDSTWRNFAFEYPASQKRAFDRLVTRASKFLTRGNDPNCR